MTAHEREALYPLDDAFIRDWRPMRYVGGHGHDPLPIRRESSIDPDGPASNCRAMVTGIDTERLNLRRLVPADAPFIVELLNDPDWLRYIGDRGVHDVADAEAYMRDGPMRSYERFGFGLLRVATRESGQPVGLCGLLQRDWLDMPDLGFAFLPARRGHGYAGEAALATLHHARDVLGISRVAALCTPDNERSIRLLENLGMRYRRRCRPQPDENELLLYVWDAGRRPGADGV